MSPDTPVSVVFSTYESPRWLEKTFWGLLAQAHERFEVIVADDGSGQATRDVVERYAPEFAARGVELRHLRQRDEGFRKCRILNEAILAARHDYLVFTDGDCICRADFLAVHVARAEPGRWLSGSYYKLPMSTSEAIGRDDVASGRCFERGWLIAHGLPSGGRDALRSRLKLVRGARAARALNRLTPTACNLKGANASAWRCDLIGAGGFDERMRWGGLDRELGVRLSNGGIRPRHVRYDAICLHLDHARGYRDERMMAANRALWRRVEREGITRTAHGIDALHDDGAGRATTPAPTPAERSTRAAAGRDAEPGAEAGAGDA